jgi:hypothetical protein
MFIPLIALIGSTLVAQSLAAPLTLNATADQVPVAFGLHLAWDDGITPAQVNKLLGRNVAIWGDFFDVGSSPLRDEKYNFTFCVERMRKNAAQVLATNTGAAYSIAVMPWEGLQLWGSQCPTPDETLYENSLFSNMSQAQHNITYSNMSLPSPYTRTQCSEKYMNGNCTVQRNISCTGVGDYMYPMGYAQEFIKEIKALSDLGLPIIIRFGHEMNGDWYPWGGDGPLFTQVWREFTKMLDPSGKGDASKRFAKMEWAPNHVPDCDYRTPEWDPYMAFWPGADYVDSVGVSMYYYGLDDDDHTENEFAPDGILERWMTGSAGISTNPQCNMYKRFADGYDKPFFFSETAAAYHVGKDGPNNLEIKKGWYKQLYNATMWQKFPRVRSINWFEIIKPEWDDLRDFRLLINQTDVRPVFLNEYPAEAMAYADGPCNSTTWNQLWSTQKVQRDVVAKCSTPMTVPSQTTGMVRPTAPALPSNAVKFGLSLLLIVALL